MGESDDVELDDALLTLVVAAGLPPEEPIMQWLRAEREGIERPDDLRLRVGDLALLNGRCEYHVHPDTGRDYSDPRSMRSQFYQPDRPGQPYLALRVEDRDPR